MYVHKSMQNKNIIIACVILTLTILVGCSEDEKAIPLPPPKNINHKVERGKISLNWESITGANTYKIYRGTQPDEKLPPISTSDSPAYEDTKIVPGNIYFYQISAVDSKSVVGIISESHQVSYPQEGKLQVSTELIDLKMLRTEDLPKSYDLKLTNVGGLALNWELSIKDDWISTDIKNGELTPQGEQSIHITIKRIEEPKTYQGTLIFKTSTEEVIQVVIKFQIGDNPHIEINPKEISFQDTKQAYTLEIKNTGTGTLIWKIQNSSDWLNLDKIDGQTGRETTSQIQMTIKNAEKLQSDKTYTATISITSNDINNPELTVKISLYLPSLPPKLYLSDADKHLVFRSGEQSQTISVRNTGEGIMKWSILMESIVPWLTVNPQNGETKAGNFDPLSFTVDKEKGTPGKTLNTTVTISAGLAGSQTIIIEFYTPDILWSISPESLTLYSGESKNITISNIGEESFSWLASSSRPSWLEINNANGIIEVGKSFSLKVTADLSQEKVGTYTGEILLTNAKGDKSATIKVLGYKIPDPVLVAISDSHSKKIVQNLQVTINDQPSITFPLGDFKLDIKESGAFRLKVERNGYITETFSGKIDEYGKSDPVKIYLRPLPHFTHNIEDSTNPFISLSGICFSADGSRAYVSDEQGSVAIIDAMADKVMSHIQIGGNPTGIIANPSNDDVYIADSEANQAVIINSRTHDIIARIDVDQYPQQLAISQDGKKLYVTCRNSKSVVKIDTTKRQVEDPHFSVGKEPYGITLSSDERILYVANFGDNNIYLIDALSGQFMGSVSVSTHPQYLAVSKDYVYVSNSFGDQVSVIDQASKRLIKNIRIGNSILLSDLEVFKEPNNEDVIYVINQTGNVLHPIDSVTMEMIKDEISIGDFPVELAIRPDLTKIYVINSGSANISVLEF